MSAPDSTARAPAEADAGHARAAGEVAIAQAIHEAECTAYTHEGRNARCERSARAVVESEWFRALLAAAPAGDDTARALERVDALAHDYEAVARFNPTAWKRYVNVAADIRAALTEPPPP